MIIITLTDTDAQTYLDNKGKTYLECTDQILNEFSELKTKYQRVKQENKALYSKLEKYEKVQEDKNILNPFIKIKAREARELQTSEVSYKKENKIKKVSSIRWTSNDPQAVSDRKVVEYAYNSPHKSERSLELLHRKMPHRSIRSIMDYCYRTYKDISFKDGYIIRN